MPHNDLPVEFLGGVLPSDTPIAAGNAPRLFAGETPPFFFITPLTIFQAQADRNSCTIHGAGAIVENKARGHGITVQVCRADSYSLALHFDGNEGRDVGVTVSSICRSLETGIVSEYERPYLSDDVTRRSSPDINARRAKGLIPKRLPVRLAEWKAAMLVSGGVAFPHLVMSNYRPDANGIVPIPAGSQQGAHLTCLEGWRDGVGLLMRQSWGPTAARPNFSTWGVDHPLVDVDTRFAHLKNRRGYGWLPYAWVNPSFVFEPFWIDGDLEVA